MGKLLSANFSRLKRDKVFWIVAAVILIVALANILISANSEEVMSESGFVVALEDFYYGQTPLMGIAFGLFMSLFLGTEYSDGTMRNKLIVGHTRIQVYLANFLTCFAAGVVFVAAWFLGGAPGFFLIGPMEMGASGYLLYLLVAIGFTGAFSALFTMIGSLSANKAMTVIWSLIVLSGLTMAASGLNDRLSCPEMLGGTAFIDGEFVTVEPTPNPLYLSGAVRTVCAYLLDFLPTGQSLLMHNVDIQHPIRQFLFSLIFTGIVTAVGVAAFRRKDLK